MANRFSRAWGAFMGRQDYRIEPDLSGELAWADPLRLFPHTAFVQYNPSELVTRKGMRILHQMRKDDEIKAALAFKKHAIISAGWRVSSPGQRSDDWAPTAFVNNNLRRLDGTLEQSLIEIMTALDFGFSVTEKVFSERNGQTWLAALKTRRPDWFKFDVDEHGNLAARGIVQETPKGHQFYPTAKFVHYIHQGEFSNPYGTSDMEAAYEHWWTKHNAIKWLGMLLERYGIPPIFALYDPKRYSPAQIDSLKTLVKTLQAASAGVIPRPSSGGGGQKDAFEFWAPELAGQVSQVFIPAFEFLDRSIARSILMPGTLGLTMDNVGSQARARVIFDLFMFIVEFLRTEIEERVVQEQIVIPLVDLNFDVDEYPEFKFLPITEDSRLELIDRWAKLLEIGAVMVGEDDEPHLRRNLKMPDRTGEGEDLGDDDPPPDDDDDEGDDSQFAVSVMPGRLPGGMKIARELTEAEQAIDFQAVSEALNDVEDRHRQTLTHSLDRVVDGVAAQIRSRGVRADAVGRLPQRKQLNDAMRQVARQAFRAGRRTARAEAMQIKAMASIAEVAPRDALTALQTAAFWIAGIVSNQILGTVRQSILTSIQVGETTAAAISRVRQGLSDFSVPGAVTTPGRVETIVRNATTNAFNQGRLNLFLDRRFDAVIPYIQHSSILDTRTTEVCRYLDGRIYRRDDPALISLAPPLHHQCRSILVPVPLGFAIDESKVMTATTTGKATDLAQTGFV